MVAREPVKIFGIYFDQGGISRTTFEILKPKLQERADELKGRCQTLKGRASLFRALVASKLWYVATVCVIPKKFIKSYTLIMFRFIWGGSVLERIKRDTLYLDKGKGGLGIIDLDRKIKALSIKHVGHLLKREGTHCKIRKTPIGEVQRFSAPNCELFQKSFKISFEKRPKCSIYVK